MNRGGPGGKREGAGRKPNVPNKVKADLANLARKYTKDALKALVAVMKDEKAPHAAIVSASVAILDRAHGRPSQTMEHSGKDGAPIIVKIAGDDANLL